MATKEELHEIMLSEHDAKMEGLARHVLSKPKKERQKWLLMFEDKQGIELADELRAKIMELYQKDKAPSHPSGA